MSKERRMITVKLDGYRPLRDIVFETLKDAIVKQDLKPGERLMEIQLADEMGVSRTPVREAIRRLEQEGLVVMVPRKGAYVSGISMKDIHDVYEVRSALEVLAVELAAERITDDELEELGRQVVRESEVTEANEINELVYIDSSFHEMIYKYARNTRLVHFINVLQEQMQRYRAVSLANVGRSRSALDEHKEIVDALAAHNGKLAAKLVKEHVANAERAMIASMQASGELFGNKE